MPSANPHEELARHIKATQLADLLDALHVTAAMALEFHAAEWKHFAALAETLRPGLESQVLVIDLLKARETVRERVARCMIAGHPKHAKKAAA